MQEVHVRAISVFFHYALPHELLALEATDKAIASLKSQFRDGAKDDELWVNLIKTCNRIARLYLKKYRKKRSGLESHHFHPKYESLKSPLIKQSQLSLGPWRQFVREKEVEELLMLIWVHIVELRSEYVALASKVTHGTLVHRLSQMINSLGDALVPGNRETNPGGLDA